MVVLYASVCFKWQLLRSMHPERENVDDHELLNSAHKKWRRTAEESLDIRTVCFVFYNNLNFCVSLVNLMLHIVPDVLSKKSFILQYS